MSKKDLMKQIKKEYKALRDWKKADPGRSGYMMYDLADGTVWSDCFLDINTVTTYKSETIDRFELGCFDTIAEDEKNMYDFMVTNCKYE